MKEQSGKSWGNTSDALSVCNAVSANDIDLSI